MRAVSLFYNTIWRENYDWKLIVFKKKDVCETLMPPKHPSFEKHDPNIWPWPLQMTLTLVLGDV